MLYKSNHHQCTTGELGHVVMLYNLCTEMSKCSLYKRERESSTSLFHLKENVGAMLEKQSTCIYKRFIFQECAGTSTTCKINISIIKQNIILYVLLKEMHCKINSITHINMIDVIIIGTSIVITILIISIHMHTTSDIIIILNRHMFNFH